MHFCEQEWVDTTAIQKQYGAAFSRQFASIIGEIFEIRLRIRIHTRPVMSALLTFPNA